MFARQKIAVEHFPPITLFLSLFFALVSASKLIMLPLKWMPATQSHKAKGFFAVAVVAVIAVLPFVFSNEFSDSRAFKYFTSQTMRTHPVPTLMSEWTIRMQPAMYHIGESLRVSIEERITNRWKSQVPL